MFWNLVKKWQSGKAEIPQYEMEKWHLTDLAPDILYRWKKFSPSQHKFTQNSLFILGHGTAAATALCGLKDSSTSSSWPHPNRWCHSRCFPSAVKGNAPALTSPRKALARTVTWLKVLDPTENRAEAVFSATCDSPICPYTARVRFRRLAVAGWSIIVITDFLLAAWNTGFDWIPLTLSVDLLRFLFPRLFCLFLNHALSLSHTLCHCLHLCNSHTCTQTYTNTSTYRHSQADACTCIGKKNITTPTLPLVALRTATPS